MVGDILGCGGCMGDGGLVTIEQVRENNISGDLTLQTVPCTVLFSLFPFSSSFSAVCFYRPQSQVLGCIRLFWGEAGFVIPVTSRTLLS